LLKADATQWMVKRLEIRNLYGSFKTLLTYVIVPRDADASVPGQWIGAILFFLFLSVLGIYGQKGAALFGNRITAIPLICVCLFYLLIVFMPLFSKYRLLLSFNSFLLLGLICYAPAIRNSYSRFYHQADRIRPGGGRAFQSVLIILTMFCFYYFSMREML